MICPHCATAGDLSATLQAQRPANDQVVDGRYDWKTRRIIEGHDRCVGPGCTCQHRITLISDRR